MSRHGVFVLKILFISTSPYVKRLSILNLTLIGMLCNLTSKKWYFVYELYFSSVFYKERLSCSLVNQISIIIRWK